MEQRVVGHQAQRLIGQEEGARVLPAPERVPCRPEGREGVVEQFLGRRRVQDADRAGIIVDSRPVGGGRGTATVERVVLTLPTEGGGFTATLGKDLGTLTVSGSCPSTRVDAVFFMRSGGE
jgi:hypothetical protein